MIIGSSPRRALDSASWKEQQERKWEQERNETQLLEPKRVSAASDRRGRARNLARQKEATKVRQGREGQETSKETKFPVPENQNPTNPSGVLANAKTLDRESIVALFYFAASSKTRNNNRTLSAPR